VHPPLGSIVETVNEIAMDLRFVDALPRPQRCRGSRFGRVPARTHPRGAVTCVQPGSTSPSAVIVTHEPLLHLTLSFFQ
jgi:hypothetical protein